MFLLRVGSKDVDGRDKRGHDTWGACVFAARFLAMTSFGLDSGDYSTIAISGAAGFFMPTMW
jgi:hypothetical protein